MADSTREETIDKVAAQGDDFDVEKQIDLRNWNLSNIKLDRSRHS